MPHHAERAGDVSMLIDELDYISISIRSMYNTIITIIRTKLLQSGPSAMQAALHAVALSTIPR